MSELIDYKIVKADTVEVLAKKVLDVMAKSTYTPLGQPFVFGNDVCQALILK